jgi:flagellar basal-body rod protein FlgB
MPLSDFPILSMLRTRMEWHQERQRVLAENVANSDTPHYQAKDLVAPDFSRQVAVAAGTPLALDRTDSSHLTRLAAPSIEFASDTRGRYEVRPRGNTVTHEDEMMKVATNQMDFEAVTSLYSHSLALIKTAIGK